jgi:hypothetical protein
LTDSILNHNSPIVLGFLLHAYANGLANDKRVPDKARSKLDKTSYSGGTWPLSLELVHLELVGNALQSVNAEAPLQLLHEGKLSLLDWKAVPKVFLREDDDLTEEFDEDYEPENAIEDFTSDYDDDSEDDEDKPSILDLMPF